MKYVRTSSEIQFSCNFLFKNKMLTKDEYLTLDVYEHIHIRY